MCCIFSATARASQRAVRDRRLAGVVFTGSTETGRIINRSLSRRDDPCALIAETGGRTP